MNDYQLDLYIGELTGKPYRDLKKYKITSFIIALLFSLLIWYGVNLTSTGQGYGPKTFSFFQVFMLDDFLTILSLLALTALPFGIRYLCVDSVWAHNEKIQPLLRIITTVPDLNNFRHADKAVVKYLMNKKKDNDEIELITKRRAVCFDGKTVVLKESLPYLQDALEWADHYAKEKIQELIDLCFDAGAALPTDYERDSLIIEKRPYLSAIQEEILNYKRRILMRLDINVTEEAFDNDASLIPDISRLTKEEIEKLVEEKNEEYLKMKAILERINDPYSYRSIDPSTLGRFDEPKKEEYTYSGSYKRPRFSMFNIPDIDENSEEEMYFLDVFLHDRDGNGWDDRLEDLFAPLDKD
ncbi:hypothetical protein M2140_000898 [Clostridiales Family XIII bacterium PM5-7]